MAHSRIYKLLHIDILFFARRRLLERERWDDTDTELVSYLVGNFKTSHDVHLSSPPAFILSISPIIWYAQGQYQLTRLWSSQAVLSSVRSHACSQGLSRYLRIFLSIYFVITALHVDYLLLVNCDRRTVQLSHTPHRFFGSLPLFFSHIFCGSLLYYTHHYFATRQNIINRR